MKIAIIHGRYSLRRGGAERYCVNLCRSLGALGHEMSVIGEQIDDELGSEVEFLPVPVRRTSSWVKNRSFCAGAERAVANHDCDLVMALGRATSADVFHVTTRIHAHWMGIRYPGSVHGACQRLNPRHRMILRLERAILREHPGLQRIVTQSRLDRQLLIDWYGVPGEKIRVIYNGVDTSTFNPSVRQFRDDVRQRLGLDRDRPLLLFASAVDYKTKGLLQVLEAVRLMRHREMQLLVVGGAPPVRFARLATDMGIGDRVVFAGYQQDIQQIYAAADLFALPSVYEPFPNVNLEAMACGVPVLTTASNGSAELVEPYQNGYLVDRADDIQQMAELFDHHVTLSASCRGQMSAACWQRASQMTLQHHAADMAELFEEIAGRSNTVRLPQAVSARQLARAA